VKGFSEDISDLTLDYVEMHKLGDCVTDAFGPIINNINLEKD